MRNAKRHREIQNDIAGPGQKFEFRASPDPEPRPGPAAAANGPPSTQNTSKLPPLVHCRCPRPSWTNARPRGCACWAPLGSGGISGPGPWSGNRDVLKFPMDPGSWIPPSAAPCSTGSTDRQVVFAGWSCFLGPTRTWRTTSWQTTTAAVGKGVVVLAPWWLVGSSRPRLPGPAKLLPPRCQHATPQHPRSAPDLTPTCRPWRIWSSTSWSCWLVQALALAVVCCWPSVS